MLVRSLRRSRCTDRKTLRDDLKYSSRDGFLSSVMVGAGETFFPAFALALGSTETTSGLIAALPFMIGSSVQLAAFRGLRACGSYRKWIVIMAILQALCFAPMMALALGGQGLPAWLLYAAVTLYWSAGLAAGPAWSSWLATLVPAPIRPRFFARRSQTSQAGLVVGMLVAGLALQIATHNHLELHAFALIFLFSGIARIGAAVCLAKHSERPTAIHEQKPLRALHAFSAMLSRRRGQGRLFRFLLIFSVSVYVASPFFNAFMLKRLELNYASYMGLVIASMLARMAVLKFVGQRTRRADPIRLMKFGLIGAALSPVTWIFSSSYIYLVAIQVLGGAVWAIYELGLMLLLFNVVRDEERTSILSVYNFAIAITILIGTSIGGSILSGLGETTSAYYVIFALSSGARLLAAVLFSRAAAFIAREREIEEATAKPVPLPRYGSVG